MKIYTIGRSGTNDLVLNDRSVSRRHAELHVDHGRFHLIDLGSTNGTYVRDGNDWAKIDQAYVAADERVMFGDTVTTVGALLGGQTARAAGPDVSIKSGDLAPQSYDAYLRQQAADPSTAPLPARPSRLPTVLLAGAILLLIAVGAFAAVRFWDQLRPLIGPSETAAPAQPAATSWERVIGGAEDDVGRAVAVTRDGGFVVAGSTGSKGAGNADLWLVRLDAAGTVVWDKTFGGDQDDAAYALDALDDGYIVAGGTVAASGKNRTAWLLRLDGIGTRLWEDTAGISDGYRAVRRLANGGFVLAGTILDQDKRSAWVVAVDAKGQNAKPFVHQKGQSSASDVQPVGDEFVAVGTLDSTGKGRPGLYVVKLDARLKPVWERNFRGRDNDAYAHVLPLADGGFLVAGTTERTDRAGTPAGSGRITRLDGAGNKLWDKLIGRGKMETINAVAPAGSDGYVLAGSIVTRGGASEDGWLVKIDGDGKIVWERHFGGDGADRINDLKALPDGGFIAVGTTASKGAGKSDLWVLRLDADGQLSAGGEAAAKKPETKSPDGKDRKAAPKTPKK
ncbi:MAG TPA: FHA domain-containing protein [Alphaproteobacteria bacterium]|nr:FHA domain-containing protein [Alphaproteobacteria bacterium]